MRNARRYGVFVPVLFLLLALATQRFVAANDPADSFTGFAQSNGPIKVTLTLDPPIVQPGETVTLRLVALNERDRDVLPQFNMTLPPVAAPQQQSLPPGAALNLQTGAINWQPVLRPGVEQVLTLPFVTGSADLNRPIQTVLVTYRTDSGSQTLRADYWAGVLPQVTVDGALRAAVGQPLPLHAEASGPGPFVQRWEMGDGRIIRADNPTVSYAEAGTYLIAVEVANPLGSTRATSRVEIVPEPAAAFETSDATVVVGQTVNFANLSGGAGPLAYQWQFGDGGSSTARTPTHSYGAPGVYDVSLTVTNALGSAETRQTVTVGAAPVADMVVDAAGRAGVPIVGRAFGDGTVERFQWDLGDGMTLEGEQIEHRYTRAGQYYVQLTASNAYGDTIIANWVTIEPGDALIFMPMVMGAGGASRNGDLAPEEQVQLILENFEPLSLDIADVPLDAAGVEKLMWYVNKARENYGLPPLSYVYELSVAAQAHVDDMASAGFTGHTGSDGSRPYERQERAGYTGYYAGEATAWGFRDPSDAVEFWVNSPSHRPMLLNPLAQELGVGYTFDGESPNIWYWTAEFGSQTVENPLPLFPTATPVPLPSPTATITATAAVTATVTVTPTADAIPLPTSTPEPIATATPTPVATPTSTPPPAPPPIPLVTPTPAVEPTATPPSDTAEPTPDPTASGEQSAPTITETPPSADAGEPDSAGRTAPPPIPLATPIPFPTAPAPDGNRTQTLPAGPSTLDAYTTAADFFTLLAIAPDDPAAPTFLTFEAQDAFGTGAGTTEWLDALLGFDPAGATVRYLNREETDSGVTLWMTFTDRDGAVHPRTVTVISDGLAWLIDAVDPVE